MGEFEKAFGRLNDEQKKAVQQIDGPVLVVAGPGTGKTELISTRVGYILKNTDTRPNNILCLTFTNKAAVNMKERIATQTNQAGSRVVVKTFHSFAAEIMNLYPDYFWNGASLSVAPQSVQLDIIESIISELPLDNPLALKFAGQYTLLNDIQRSIGLAKDAGLTPDKLRAIINFNIAYIDVIEQRMVDLCNQRLSTKNLNMLEAGVKKLPKQKIGSTIYPLMSLSQVINESLGAAVNQDADSGKTTNVGRWKTRWVQTVDGQKSMWSERQRNNWWLELANVYQKYRSAAHQRGFYDYADMLVEVISQLEQNPGMLADIQERFSYVMIDEFQDTNPAQLRLAHLVTDHHAVVGRPNLMAVGDDDQSIYKFNGAELNNMLGFKRSYSTAKVIVLTKNYRSTQNILNAAKKIIEQAQIRLINSDKSLSKNLVAAKPPQGGTIKALSYSSRELQLSEIARDIKKNYQPTRAIAVLARSHESLLKICGILQQLNVPVRYEQASNILDHEIINQTYCLILLLLAIQNGDKQTSDAMIHQIIRAPWWAVEPKDLWSLARENYQNPNWLESLLKSPKQNINQIGNWFVSLAQQSANQPLAVTIEHILGLRPCANYTSPIRAYFVNANDADANKYFHGLSAIQLLRALVHEFAQNGEPTLEELARFIEINYTNNRIVPDESPFITGDHAVQLLSVHKAKGLEFDHVYIIDATQDNWTPRTGSRKPPANLPLQPVGDDLDDYVRLTYVAATRAKSSLTISGYYKDHAGKDVALSSIIQSAFDIQKISIADKKILTAVLEENLRWPELSGGQETEILKARLETYNLSVTHLLNFLDLTKGGPQYFKERNLLQLPEIKSVSLAYGTAIHCALEYGQRLTNLDQFDGAKIKEAFSKSLLAQQLSLPEFKRFEQKGFQTLNRLFTDFKYVLPKGSAAEQKLRNIKVGNALISGKLDRVDMAGNSLKIIDYKTGAPLNNFSTRAKNQVLKAYKHKKQLIFYALLSAESPNLSNYSNIEGQMVYVEAQSPKDLLRSYKPTKEDIETLKKLINAVWLRIKDQNYPDVSSYPKDFEGILQFENDLLD